MVGLRGFAQRSTRTAVMLASTMLAAAPLEQALAQDSDEIIVTARKRSENLQEVPDTITAFSSEQINERRLYKIDDFLGLTPNVRINADQDAANNNISIRGLGANRNQAAAVAFAVDGVILPDSDAFTMDLSDAERVEVLKGPQGALYGRGAIAGAINVTTRKPGNETELEAKAGYSSGENVRLFGAVSGPLSQDKVFARLTATYLDKDGTVDNSFSGKGLDNDRQVKIGGRLIFEPSDRLRFDFTTSYFDQRAGALYFNASNVLGTSQSAIREADAARAPNMDGLNLSKREVLMAALTTELELDSGTLTSITAYDDINFVFNEDLDASPFPLISFTEQIRNTEGFSQELRYTSASDTSLRYLLGVYYQHSERLVETRADFDACLFAGDCVTPGGVVPSGVSIPLELARSQIKLDQYAAFAQLNYDITEQLELTGALRYDHVDGAQNDILAGQRNSADFAELQPKFSLAFKPSADQTFYATFARGFKAGTFNAASAVAAFPRVVEAETSTNYEIGTKLRLFDRVLLFNAAAFYTEHNNPQIFQLDPATVTQGTLNANKVKIKGFEFDLQLRPAKGLTLSAAFGYTDARIKDFDGTARFVDQRMPNAPEYTLNIGAHYVHDLTDTLEASLRLDYFAVGEQSFQDFQNPNPNQYLVQGSYGTFDGQLGIQSDKWSATLFAKNIFDRRYATSAFSRWIAPFIFLPLDTDLIQPDPGRIVGFEFRVKY